MNRAEQISRTVIGFLVPEYTNERTGEHTFSDPVAFEKVRLGYACAVCLAEFGTYMPVCPLCRNERDVFADMRETPEDIQSYWEESQGPGERTVARPMHEVIEEIVAGRGPEMERIPLKKLRPSRWGAGH